MNKAIEKNARIYIAGHRGLVGSAVLRKLKEAGYTNLITRTHAELDLLDQRAVQDFFETERPHCVFLAAAKVGGIGANSAFPADFIYQNTMIGFHIVHAAYSCGSRKLINLGSTCIYPKLADQPIKEESLLSGPLEETNDAYALAKISTIKLCTSYNRQYGTNFLSVMPTNLYGINDTYDLDNAHVLPSLIRKFHEAKLSHRDEVILWGDGSPYREFLFSDDLAEFLVHLMNTADASDVRNPSGDFINAGSGQELSIKALAELIAQIIYEDAPGRQCKITWDTTKPNGTPRKLCDISRLASLGWKSRTRLDAGIRIAYSDFKKRYT